MENKNQKAWFLLFAYFIFKNGLKLSFKPF